METRRNTTAGVPLWTSAPARASPASSDEAWEQEDDFASQMDDNGIIGLSEVLENAGLGETSGRADAEYHPGCYARPLTPEEASPRGRDSDTSTEEPNYSPSEHLTLTEAPGEDLQVLSPFMEPTSPHSPALTFPPFLRSAAEEIAAAPWIAAETFPEMGFTESLPESHSSRASHKSNPGKSERRELKALEDEHRNQRSRSQSKMSQPSPDATPSRICSLKSRQSSHTELRTPRTRTHAAEVNESRNGPLTYRTPDFSKVEPKVHFPKGGYKPPRSRRSSKRDSLSPEPPVVYKSPADIVKEVLLPAPHASPAPSDSYSPPVRALNLTVPQEFRSRRQATSLLDQLQEEHRSLLTKYAEARNTIDRLRLEAKVNLYSEPPKPGHLVLSGPSHDASNLMSLDFPQRAELSSSNSASLPPNGHSADQSSEVGQQLADILYSQADKFLQQLQTFEDLLKGEKLKPCEQMKGLSQLDEGLRSLERGYLSAREEHKLLQQRGAEISHFDPERELDGLIYQCGRHMDELKEQVEQMRQEQPTCEAPPSPPRQPTPSSVLSEGGESQTGSQRLPVASLVDLGGAAEVEASSASEEREEEEAEAEDEETLNSQHLRPLYGECALIDHFREHPNMFDPGLGEELLLSAALGIHMPPGDEETERRGQRTENVDVQRCPPHRQAESDHQESPVDVSKQGTSRASPAPRRASSQSTLLPVYPPSSLKTMAMGKSHSSSLSSLGEIAASERRNSKVQTGSNRVLSQDGIISPETDSGFVGSESSRLAPAAAPTPLHQRASQSGVSVHQMGTTEKPQTSPVSAPSPASRGSTGASQLSPEQPNRSRQGQRRRTFSCSLQHWVSQSEQTADDSRASEFGLESDSAHTGSEDRESGQYAESMNSPHSSSQPSSSSSSSARYHHGDSVRALCSRQVANRNDALQALQAEVTRLTERLESFLRNAKPLSSTSAAQENYIHHYTSTPRFRSGERCQSDVSRGRGERRTADEGEEAPTLRRTAVPERPAPPPQPQTSRYTQTWTATPDSAHSRRRQPGQHPAASTQVPQTADEPDGRSHQAPLCLHCSSRQRRQPDQPVRGSREPALSSSRCHRCLLCGRPQPNRGTKTDRRRESDAAAQTGCRPPDSPDGAARRGYTASPAAALQCMPVCPPPLLMYSLPLYTSPSNSTATSSGVRGHREARGRGGRWPSADEQCSLDSSLNRAIRAARHMKHTSGHMARSLATGLQHQEQLTRSCS